MQMEYTSAELIYLVVFHWIVFLALFYIFYWLSRSDVIDLHSVSHQLYADDTQIYKSWNPIEVNDIIHGV